MSLTSYDVLALISLILFLLSDAAEKRLHRRVEMPLTTSLVIELRGMFITAVVATLLAVIVFQPERLAVFPTITAFVASLCGGWVAGRILVLLAKYDYQYRNTG